MYVKDLEMKSKYLEGECRRLGRLLQCCYADNHALRLTLQMGNAFGASTTKQESAVLLLGMIMILLSLLLASSSFSNTTFVELFCAIIILFMSKMLLVKISNFSSDELIMHILLYIEHFRWCFNCSDIWFFCRIPAVGFPALVPGHHVPVHPASEPSPKSGDGSSRRRGKEGPTKRGSKRARK